MRHWRVAAMALAWGSAQPANACVSDPQLDYVCGPEKPEDLLALPGTEWLIASGFAPGAGLKIVHVPTRRFERWYAGTPDQIAWDRRAFAGCPGPVDPALFNARGLSLRETGPGRWRLLVVNHGGRESIEVFDIEARSGRPRLRWRGCLVMPEGQVGNSVASFADGTILVTVLTRPGTTIADFVEGRVTGGVWQHDPRDEGFRLLPGTELPGNNGLETDPDGRHFYVVAFGWHAVLVFDRRDTRIPAARIEVPDFMPDNIHWSGTRLLLAGMRLDEPACGGLRRIVDGVADPMLCHRGWVVGELDRSTRRVATVAYGPPQPGFNGLSAATIASGELWLGSFQSNRLAIVRGGTLTSGRSSVFLAALAP
ncbi:SMP-30/gluconolactonase/LRE family protein [Sphingomonas psychrotolerans]|uniref:SMP-30/Gluconolactonase/LRE-like region domain-containing protein n=1 Tax=Sphingomonas psychrotolerans TaxID=1327635 RepID=A0A2K8MH25_9SPHN|nr:hypothetical protein [Sphingomonas psychrotolerans]ATY31049.1 hypothetical protein CVN68_02835 [Sphingomonas psychrotolerans]